MQVWKSWLLVQQVSVLPFFLGKHHKHHKHHKHGKHSSSSSSSSSSSDDEYVGGSGGYVCVVVLCFVCQLTKDLVFLSCSCICWKSSRSGWKHVVCFLQASVAFIITYTHQLGLWTVLFIKVHNKFIQDKAFRAVVQLAPGKLITKIVCLVQWFLTFFLPRLP